MKKPTIICFGEALWDVLPRGIFLGGAPLNVAYHLARHGARSIPISAVGADWLGAEIIRRVAAWGLESRFIARLPKLPTGTVRATLDARRNARYEIARRVAWDKIPISAELRRLPEPAALVFGSLALREPPNRRALQQLFTAWPSALRVVDLNLRSPFDRGAGVGFALRHAHVLKLNHDELARLLGRGVRADRPETATRKLAAQLHLRRICVTAGASGAGLLWDGAWFWQAAHPVVVRDTVGAGDSFLGALLAGLLGRGASPATALAAACRVAEFVATQDGATPDYKPAALVRAETKTSYASPACSMPEIED